MAGTPHPLAPNHAHPAPDTSGEASYINVTWPGEDSILPLVQRIVQAEVIVEFLICVCGKVHLPDPVVIAQEREGRRQPLIAGFQRSAGKGWATALRSAAGSHSGGIHARHVLDYIGKLRCVEEYVAEQQFIGLVVQPVRDLTGKGTPLHVAHILGQPPFTPTIHRRRMATL